VQPLVARTFLAPSPPNARPICSEKKARSMRVQQANAAEIICCYLSIAAAIGHLLHIYIYISGVIVMLLVHNYRDKYSIYNFNVCVVKGC
jgi:hypothetical protein